MHGRPATGGRVVDERHRGSVNGEEFFHNRLFRYKVDHSGVPRVSRTVRHFSTVLNFQDYKNNVQRVEYIRQCGTFTGIRVSQL